MRIGVTSQNFRTITGHAGKTRRFLIFEQDATGAMREAQRLDLPLEMSLHEFRGDDRQGWGSPPRGRMPEGDDRQGWGSPPRGRMPEGDDRQGWGSPPRRTVPAGDQHPLFALDALITESCGEGFIQRLARHGVRVIATSASDPLAAVTALASGQALPAPRSHDHNHDHAEGVAVDTDSLTRGH
jgi:hypothetical protein